MLRYLLTALVFVHGLIHLMGFAKAFNYGNIAAITKNISKPAGLLWLTVALFLIATAIGLLIKKDWWWQIALPAIILSQYLIITVWSDARYGTIVNVIILLAIIGTYGNWHFEKKYLADVDKQMQQQSATTSLLVEKDLELLPTPVQRYLRYVGIIGKPKVSHAKFTMKGEMRSKKKDWFPFTSAQHNFFNEPTRLFFMKGRLFGISVPGYHTYKRGRATMDIKLCGTISLVHHEGPEMDKAETVTLFNDMCLLAPATLIDKRITWQEIDDISVNAFFTNHDITISATLHFNSAGQLINFISEDRYDVNEKSFVRFSTPVRSYANFGGLNLMNYAEAIWHYSTGEFTYGKFWLKQVEYNA